MVRSTINLLCISNRKYYKIKNKLQQKHPILIQPPLRQLLTDDEEIYIIQKVHEYQLQNDCLTSKDIRDIAQQIYQSRCGITKCFSRDWFLHFRERHEEIEKIRPIVLKKKCQIYQLMRSTDTSNPSSRCFSIHQFLLGIALIKENAKLYMYIKVVKSKLIGKRNNISTTLMWWYLSTLPSHRYRHFSCQLDKQLIKI